MPASLEMLVRLTPVARFVTVTDTPGITAPEGSVILPLTPVSPWTRNIRASNACIDLPSQEKLFLLLAYFSPRSLSEVGGCVKQVAPRTGRNFKLDAPAVQSQDSSNTVYSPAWSM